jgi:hypothetical protein
MNMGTDTEMRSKGTDILFTEIGRRTKLYGDHRRAYKEVLLEILNKPCTIVELRLVLLAMVEMA